MILFILAPTLARGQNGAQAVAHEPAQQGSMAVSHAAWVRVARGHHRAVWCSRRWLTDGQKVTRSPLDHPQTMGNTPLHLTLDGMARKEKFTDEAVGSPRHGGVCGQRR
jgi:hypothetical protein